MGLAPATKFTFKCRPRITLGACWKPNIPQYGSLPGSGLTPEPLLRIVPRRCAWRAPPQETIERACQHGNSFPAARSHPVRPVSFVNNRTGPASTLISWISPPAVLWVTHQSAGFYGTSALGPDQQRAHSDHEEGLKLAWAQQQNRCRRDSTGHANRQTGRMQEAGHRWARGKCARLMRDSLWWFPYIWMIKKLPATALVLYKQKRALKERLKSRWWSMGHFETEKFC